ncbi:hypothetical protein D7Z26_11180 [Cohnella endophytica]|uniref:Uncharacterized protein n=1 Tax=Cohnella endophytica TaxID=2419778 RepID=A0A494XTM9_9BACL|nr:hypothetical protein [Cohnella endophytica]RKP53948.1 hypothetical protein D7Z26_11180 [Cohnella endophytica]
MAVVICPWCQSEIIQEEGQEPEKYCPVCDNELDGYRTLKLNIGEDEDEYDDEEDDAGEDQATVISIDDEDLSWVDEETLVEPNDELQQFEETVEQLLNEQELVPECPVCREYMVESGELLISANQFRHRTSETLGGDAVIEAPFTLTMYVCPSCFAVQQILGDAHRHQVVRRLSLEPTEGNEK